MKIKKNILMLASLTLLPLTFVSCGDKNASEETGDATNEVQSAKPYPLDVCLVSGEELGSMGEPHVFVHEGQEIKMCCDKCVPKFEKNPEKYLAKLKLGKSSKESHDHADQNH